MKIRAAVHVHSEWSYDARWSLPRLADLFRVHGYTAILLAEHDRGFTHERWNKYRDACAEISTDDLLLIPGIEYSDAGNTVHVTTWGSLPFLGEGSPTDQLITRVSDGGGIAFLAHPSRRAAWQHYRREWSRHLSGIELWNRKSDGWAPSEDAKRLLERTELPAIGAMDFHTPKQFFPLAMVLDVQGRISEASVLHCLAVRNFHCEVFGRALESVAEPVWRMALRAAEAVRRQLSRSVRFIRGARNLSVDKVIPAP